MTITITVSESSVYDKLQKLRLLARRDSDVRSPKVDQELELFRLSFLQAFEAWMDGMRDQDLTPFVVQADKIITSNRELLRWLQKELEKDLDR